MLAERWFRAAVRRLELAPGDTEGARKEQPGGVGVDQVERIQHHDGGGEVGAVRRDDAASTRRAAEGGEHGAGDCCRLAVEPGRQRTVNEVLTP